MTQPLRATSLEEAKAYIDAIDFSMIINKIVKTKHWKEKEAAAICVYYKNFLYLNKQYEKLGQLPPSEEIDEFWHNHILDTEKYIKDCDAIFGKYLHHYPYFGMDGKSNEQDLSNAFEHMQQLYKKEFGDQIYRVRNPGFLEIIKITLQIIKQFFSKKNNIK